MNVTIDIIQLIALCVSCFSLGLSALNMLEMKIAYYIQRIV